MKPTAMQLAIRNVKLRHRLAIGLRLASWMWIVSAAAIMHTQLGSPVLGAWGELVAAALIVAPGAFGIFLSWGID